MPQNWISFKDLMPQAEQTDKPCKHDFWFQVSWWKCAAGIPEVVSCQPIRLELAVLESAIKHQMFSGWSVG